MEPESGERVCHPLIADVVLMHSFEENEQETSLSDSDGIQTNCLYIFIA